MNSRSIEKEILDNVYEKKNKTNQNKKNTIKKKPIKKKVTNTKFKKRKIKNVKKISKTSFKILIGGTAVFLLIIGRVIFFQIGHQTLNGVNLNEFAAEQYKREETLEAQRGTIYDSKGKPLAQNIKIYEITVHLSGNEVYDPQNATYIDDNIENPKEDANKIIEILGYENDQKAKELITSQINLDPKKYSQVKLGIYGNEITQEQKEELEKSNIKGLTFDEKTKRFYPYDTFASYILGYVKEEEVNSGATYGNDTTETNMVGELGIEKTLDSYLRGEDGTVVSSKDNKGVPQKTTQTKEKTDGANVYLTLDSIIQMFISEYMQKGLSGYNYDRATTVVMDAHSGEVLGAESYPNFDPNKKNVTEYTDPFNTCIEPGSTIKTFLVSTAIEEGKWKDDNTVVSGKRSNPRWGEGNTIADWLYNETKETWGTITWKEGFYFSSNVTMTYILDAVGYDTWKDYAKNKFEFGKEVDTELKQIDTCDFSPKYDFETATTTFGQGMTANPLELLRYYSIYANEGKMITPHFVKSINDSENGEEIYNGMADHPQSWSEEDADITVDKKTGQYKRQVISPKTADKTLDLLHGAMNYNAGGNFYATGSGYGEATKYDIAGKTGTSQIAIDGSYDNNSGLYSAMILAPADDPQIIMYTSILNPQDSYPNPHMTVYIEGIIDNTLNYLTSSNVNKTYSYETKYEITEDYIGKTDKELKKINQKYKKIGSGKVIAQYPQKETQMSKNGIVYLVGEDYKTSDFIGKNIDEGLEYCTALNFVCEVKGSGNKIKKVTSADVEKKYYFEVE